FSRERVGSPGTFFHGTMRAKFEELYSKYGDAFFIIFLLGFPKTMAGLVMPARRFKDMFQLKEPATRGSWTYAIHLVDGKYIMKTWGVGDYDVTDNLHRYDLVGLTQEQSLSLKGAISSFTRDRTPEEPSDGESPTYFILR